MIDMLKLLETNNQILSNIIKPLLLYDTSNHKVGLYEGIALNHIEKLIQKNQEEINNIHDIIEDMAVDAINDKQGDI